MISFKLNGQEVQYDGRLDATLLQWLRLEANMKSVKDGCSGEGTCGACIVEFNGKPNLACRVPMKKVENAEVVTLEGIPEETRDILGQAFVTSGAVQCGFCSPGMLTRTKLLLQKNPNPTREEVTKKIKPHICRCTGYVKIVDAVMLSADMFNNGTKIEEPTGAFGSSPPKFQALERAVGKGMFVGGIEFDNLAHGVLHFTKHPRAKILKIDTSKAEAVEGVIRVFTAKDVPGTRNVGMIVKDWDVYIAEGEITRYIGDVLAMVVAESNQIARDASELIEVEYEVLEPLTCPHEALKSDIKVHEGGNLLKETTICYGEDVEKVFENSAHVVEETFQTQFIEHAFMELENCVSQYEDGRLTVYSQGQGIYEDRHQISDLLGLDIKDINVKLVPAGGAFGGKEDLSVQGHSALAAFHLKRAVKVKLNRTESMAMHPKRHPMTMEYKLGCDADGKFTALKCRIVGDTGAYASVGGPVMERAATHAGGAYFVPNVDVNSKAVYTNNVVCGAMRGFGVNQVTFAMEGIIDELCDRAGFDRWELRYKNALDVGLKTTSGHLLKKEVGLKKTLELVKEEYDSGNVVGLACGIKNCGIGNGIPELSEARVTVVSEDHIQLFHGWSEMGQGIDTVAQQMLCQYLGLNDTSIIEVLVSTDSETKAGNTTASRGTFLVGKAVIAAAEDLKKDLETHTLAELAGKSYDGSYLCDWTTPSDFDGDVVSHFAYSFATQLVTLTDDGKISKVTAVHDSGTVVNRKLYEGQIEGGVVMGLGYALTENLVLEGGKIVDPKFRSLGLLRSTDVPEIEVIPVEIPDVDAPFGAKGVGEICCIPTAAAAAGAFRKFDGKKRISLPVDPVEMTT